MDSQQGSGWYALLMVIDLTIGSAGYDREVFNFKKLETGVEVRVTHGEASIGLVPLEDRKLRLLLEDSTGEILIPTMGDIDVYVQTLVSQGLLEIVISVEPGKEAIFFYSDERGFSLSVQWLGGPPTLFAVPSLDIVEV